MVLSVAGCNSTDVGNKADSGSEGPKETVEQTELVQADSEQDADVEEQTSTEAVEETTVPSLLPILYPPISRLGPRISVMGR